MKAFRLSPVVSAIISAEKGSLSEADYVASLIIGSVKTDQGRELLLGAMQADPLANAALGFGRRYRRTTTSPNSGELWDIDNADSSSQFRDGMNFANPPTHDHALDKHGPGVVSVNGNADGIAIKPSAGIPGAPTVGGTFRSKKKQG